MTHLEKCPGCLRNFPSSTESTLPHPYMGASHACWNVYCDILAKEFSNKEYFIIHRITVDSYTAQHIGNQTDRRARQSANIHLIALYLYFEKEYDINEIMDLLRQATRIKRDWPAVSQLEKPKWLTASDIIKAKDANEHINLALKWGQSVWDAYACYHEDIINTYQNFMSSL